MDIEMMLRLRIKNLADKLEAELQLVNPSNRVLESYYLQLVKLAS